MPWRVRTTVPPTPAPPNPKARRAPYTPPSEANHQESAQNAVQRRLMTAQPVVRLADGPRADKIRRLVVQLRNSSMTEEYTRDHLKTWRYIAPPRDRRRMRSEDDRAAIALSQATQHEIAAFARQPMLTPEEIDYVMRAVWTKRKAGD